ncbi:MAG: selenium-dependent molybdenum cofactor biosynthesis protein YqeB [Anaerolineae bacterium]
MFEGILVVVKGGGDLGTGVVHRLHRAGMKVVVIEVAQPTVIRRAVAFASAVYEGEVEIEGVVARRAEDASQALDLLEKGAIPVVIDPTASLVKRLKPLVLVDAIVAKRNIGTNIDDAPVVIALGPGFTAGLDAHAVIETQRGHHLGRVILEGSAQPDTGLPGAVMGYTTERVLHAPVAGVFQSVRRIGERVVEGQIVAYVDDAPVRAGISGVLRGLLADGLTVRKGMKIGDIDPRGVVEHCFAISDKARAVGGGVLEAILYLLKERGISV